ncbi:TPA: F-box protein [Legionella pneumophila]|nr:F-box protein [Legionella pneumophila]HAT8181214.1 F-box protein [Legionella pneumophila]
MQDFDGLAAAHKLVITKYLSNSDIAKLAQTSRAHSEFFQPLLDVPKFLHYVVRGEYDAVQAMLEKDSSLIFKRGVVRDCSGREFENISGFEYALWALDKHMWAHMIACIPTNEEGRKVFEKILAQYNKVNTMGVTYKLNGKPITERHFDFENTIIKELQTQVDSINTPGDMDLDAIDEQWRVGVGGAQKQLPMHVVDEYCSNELFYPVPKFISPPKSSKKFYNLTTHNYEDWFGVDSKLGSEIAIYRSAWGPCAFRSREFEGRAIHGIVQARVVMKALCEVRTLDLINLKSQLKEHASLDNYHQVVPR